MVKTLIRHGDSYALIIDEAIMELLQIHPETKLEISTDGKCLVVRPVDSTRDEKIEKVLEHTCEKYHDAFKKLAE